MSNPIVPSLNQPEPNLESLQEFSERVYQILNGLGLAGADQKLEDKYLRLAGGSMTGRVLDLMVDKKGLYVRPGMDQDATLIKVDVTGQPELWWNEKKDAFSVNKGLRITDGTLHVVYSDASNPVCVKVHNTDGTASAEAALFLLTSFNEDAQNIGAVLLADRTNVGGAGSTDLLLKCSYGSAMNTIMTLKASRDVGIGTTDPESKLDVRGNITGGSTAGNAHIRTNQSGNQAAGGVTYTWVGNTGTGMRRASSNVLAFDTASIERLGISASGVISIPGTAEIAGGATKSQLKLTQSGAGALSGYIFDADSAHWGFDIDRTGGQWIARDTSYAMISKWENLLRFRGDTGQTSGNQISPSAPVDLLLIDLSNGKIKIPNLTASQDVQTDGSKNLISSSDERLKNILEYPGYGLDEILKIKPILFRFKHDPQEGQSVIGFSAQNVKKVIPECVTENDEGFMGINSRGILAATVTAIQQLASRIEALGAA